MDEVHILNEDRGAVLEVVVSRMKTLGHVVRFVAVSATVPNIEDVASWLGPNSSSRLTAKTHNFGDEYRPVVLQKHVYGYESKSMNDFQFGAVLNIKIMELVQKHASGKPVLVFCSTRKACSQAAEKLVEQYKKLVQEMKPPWPVPPNHRQAGYSDKKLQDLATTGIAFHHAGLSTQDRQAVEQAFVRGDLHVICTTSTLAVGVNLPARMRRTGGTKQWDPANGGSSPYSDLDLMQMMGRAGRPQFDKSGVAVIMTEQENKVYYESLARSETTLESRLHKNLVEHVNSEIALQTITSIDSALEWLRSTFLYVRASLNPTFYGVQGDDLPDKRLEEIVRQAIDTLGVDGIVQDVSGNGAVLACTGRGEIMSRLYIAHSTFVKFCNIKSDSSIRDVLHLVAQAKEFESLRLRAGEKAALLAVCKRPEIRFEVKKITSVADKVVVLAQVILGTIPFSELKTESADAAQLPIHAAMIMKDAPRLLRGLVDLLLQTRDAGSLRSALELLRSVAGRAWEGTANVLRQLDGIGEKSIKRSGIWSFEQLINTPAAQLELLLNRQPPFGKKLIGKAKAFPRLSIEMINWDEKTTADGILCTCELTVGLHNEGPVNGSNFGAVNIFCVTSDNQWIDFRRIRVNKIAQTPKSFPIEVTLTRNSQKIQVLASVDSVAGSEVRLELVPETSMHSRPSWAATAASDLPSDHFALAAQVKQEEPETAFEELEAEPPTPPPQSRKRTLSKTDEQTQNAPVVERETVRLPNGNYKCGHTCKKACRHLCCREGLEKPPVAKKVKTAPTEPSITPLNTVGPGSTSKAAPVRKDKSAKYSSLLDSLNSASGSSTHVETLKSKSKGPRAAIKPAPPKPRKPTPEIDYMAGNDDLPDLDSLFDEPLQQPKEPLFRRSPSPPRPSKRLLPTSESTPERQPQQPVVKKRRTSRDEPESLLPESPEPGPEDDDDFENFLDSMIV